MANPTITWNNNTSILRAKVGRPFYHGMVVWIAIDQGQNISSFTPKLSDYDLGEWNDLSPNSRPADPAEGVLLPGLSAYWRRYGNSHNGSYDTYNNLGIIIDGTPTQAGFMQLSLGLHLQYDGANYKSGNGPTLLLACEPDFCPDDADNPDVSIIPEAEEIGIDIDIDLDTFQATARNSGGTIPIGGADQTYLFHLKRNDTIPATVRFFRGDVQKDIDVSSIKFGAKQYEPERLLPLADGTVTKTGSGDTAAYHVTLDPDGEIFSPALFDYEDDAGTFFLPLTEIEVVTGGGARRTTPNFKIHFERDLVK
ncbi:MAG: hypothetical protein AAF191_05040 [Verrucomicrobiota bacterium]